MLTLSILSSLYLLIAALFDTIIKSKIRQKRYSAQPRSCELSGRIIASLLWLPFILWVLWNKASGKR